MKVRKSIPPSTSVMETKRKAASDLNHDNWDEDEEPEDKGSFQTASEEELSNRVIKKAKRKSETVKSEDMATSKNIFSGFSGFSSAPPATPFSFLAQKSFATSDNKDESKPETKSDDKTTKDESSFGLSDANSYHGKLKGLNQEVSKWIKTHVDKNPLCILSPIFKDYEKYLEEIKSKSAISSTISSTNIKDQKSADSTATKPIFGKPDTVSTSFFERKSGSTLSFGSTTLPSDKTSFSFSSSQPFSFSSAIAKPEDQKPEEKNQEAEDEDTPPKVEFKPVVEEDSVYTKKCKIFVKGETNYVERGVGTLYVKPIKDSIKKQLLVRADTNLGNILLNIILSEGIPTQRLGKNNVMIICIPTPESDPKPTPVLLRVKSGEEADELQSIIEKYKK